MHTNNIEATTKLATTKKVYTGRTAYNAANWNAMADKLAKGPATVAELSAAILEAVPNQQPHHAPQFVKYLVRGGYLVPAK